MRVSTTWGVGKRHAFSTLASWSCWFYFSLYISIACYASSLLNYSLYSSSSWKCNSYFTSALNWSFILSSTLSLSFLSSSMWAYLARACSSSMISSLLSNSLSFSSSFFLCYLSSFSRTCLISASFLSSASRAYNSSRLWFSPANFFLSLSISAFILATSFFTWSTWFLVSALAFSWALFKAALCFVLSYSIF